MHLFLGEREQLFPVQQIVLGVEEFMEEGGQLGRESGLGWLEMGVVVDGEGVQGSALRGGELVGVVEVLAEVGVPVDKVKALHLVVLLLLILISYCP